MKGKKKEVEGAVHLPEEQRKQRKNKDGLRLEIWNRVPGADPLSKKENQERGSQCKDNLHFPKTGTKTDGDNHHPQGRGMRNKCGLREKKSQDIGGLFQGSGTDIDIPLLEIDKRLRIEMLEGRDPPRFPLEIGKDAPLRFRGGIGIIDRRPFPLGSATGRPVLHGSIGSMRDRGSRISKGSLHPRGSTETIGFRSTIGFHLLPGSRESGHLPENSRSGLSLGRKISGRNTENIERGNIMIVAHLIKTKM